MENLKHSWIAVAILLFLIIFIPIMAFLPGSPEEGKSPWKDIIKKKTHLDHSAFFRSKFKRPQDVTKACLKCHEDAAENLMKTVHWKWEGDAVAVPGHSGKIRIGKKNLINNFCIGIRGNWSSCVSCHAGYGWNSADFDFNNQENVDCLVCHDWTGGYAKGKDGLPRKGVDLLSVAKSVGYPKRENCGLCHNYGGGGMGVKHGDLDQSLVNPLENTDAHMGKHDLLCIDCHKTEKHNIKGKAFSVSVNHENGISCTDCHENVPHRDRRINAHLDALACQTCHIPNYAKKAPTKTDWDWSKAGNPLRKDDPHQYLKIKGEFIYDENIVPEYDWFNLTTNRYILGDKIDASKYTHINDPIGEINDSTSKIWPFKIHRALQPYDRKFNYLLQPVTSGKGGYWHEFNWDKALRLGAEVTDFKYSGSYGFTKTDMHWPLSHMVSPADNAVKCCECHPSGETKSRMNWKVLGYVGDPVDTGGRKYNEFVKEEEGKR